MSRYVEVNDCDWIVDLELTDQKEPSYVNRTGENSTHTWTFSRVYSAPFLDASKSPSLTRAFCIPYISHWKNTMARYLLIQKKATSKSFHERQKKKGRKNKKTGKTKISEGTPGGNGEASGEAAKLDKPAQVSTDEKPEEKTRGEKEL